MKRNQISNFQIPREQQLVRANIKFPLKILKANLKGHENEVYLFTQQVFSKDLLRGMH